jgi:hypothetical protein
VRRNLHASAFALAEDVFKNRLRGHTVAHDPVALVDRDR